VTLVRFHCCQSSEDYEYSPRANCRTLRPGLLLPEKLSSQCRWYEPRLGRFVSADTVVPNPGNPQDLNRYAYTRNNPLRYTDPTGHCPWCVPLAIAVLKGIDYGWTAYDVWQASRVLSNPNASRDEKLLAGLNVTLAVTFEACEPDDELPVAIPLDDIGRRMLMAGASHALAEGGEEALERYLRERLGASADEVLEWVMREAGEESLQTTGQWHHVFSSRIMRALNEHPTLHGVFDRDDILVQALDEISHRGYQKWHRAYDDEVVEWLIEHQDATPEEFLHFMQEVYARPGMQWRFPNASNQIERLSGGMK